MQVGQKRNNYDRIDLNLVIPSDQHGDQFLHYTGNSMWDACEKTLNIISKVTVIINVAQLNELFEKPSNFQVNPLRIDVFEGTKPDTPVILEPLDQDDNLVFDLNLYSINYGPYPPTESSSPQEQSSFYPSPYFPYPDAWPWVGEPSYPNDPWYPLYVFPPVPPMEYPGPCQDLPPVLTYEDIYPDVNYPDQSPNWPFGYPIWPQITYPVWPQNADFYAKISDPYSDTRQSPKYAMNGTTPVAPFPFNVHPMLPYPFYAYLLPITYYPHFPTDHWPDDVFDPELYEGYPEHPNNKMPTATPSNPEIPSDVKLHWPQNPFYRWPQVPGYKWPEDQRWIWPASPEDPKWFWPSNPIFDPKWRQPADSSGLNKPKG